MSASPSGGAGSESLRLTNRLEHNMSYRSDLMVARDLWNNRDSLNLPKEVYLRQIIQAMLRHAELDTSEGCPVCGGTDYNTYVGGFSSTEADIDVECGRCYFSWLVHMTPANR